MLDTLARAMPGVDENSAQELGLVIQRCDAVREHFGCTVAPVHHMGKDAERGMRGSSALLGAVDASYVVRKLGKGVARLTNDAMKDAEEFEPLTLIMERVTINGRSSIVPRVASEAEAPAEESPEERRAKLAPDAQAAYRILCDLIAEEGSSRKVYQVSEDAWRRAFYGAAKPGASQDTKKRAFARAAGALISAGFVAMKEGMVSVPHSSRNL